MPPTQSDRRRERRKLTRTKTTVACRKGHDGLGADLSLRLIDLSDEGARLMVKEWINPRADVELSLESVAMNRPLQVAGQVAWCQPIEKGFLIGVKFHERIDYTDLRHLV